MGILVRRSNLSVPITDTERVNRAWQSDADAVTLDLEDGVVELRKAEARGLVKEAIALAARGGAEVFVRVNAPLLHADLDASVWPGLRGVVLPRVESAADVAEATEQMTALERRRGLGVGALELIVLLESARAVWDIRSIVTASPRITQVGLDESDLAGDLGITPLPEHDPYVYARGRLVVEATDARVQPIGITYPLGVHPRRLPPAEIQRLATDARNLGMKGVLCPDLSWVAPVNDAFTPSADLVAHNKRVREVFAGAVAAGTAAVPLNGRMIDVPVDEWAKVVLAMAEACDARDAQKRAARAGS
jgi:citrate lyase subunit beta / citryl-CoA lyase